MQLFRRSRTRREMASLVREGVGVREAFWDVSPGAGGLAQGTLVNDIVAWMRDAMGAMRRPYGINEVVVAFACRDGSGRVMFSDAFGVMRPADFYGETGPDRLRAFLGGVESVPAEHRARIVGAVLSLGDLAYAMDPAAAA